MSGGIASGHNLAPANTAFIAKGEELFGNVKPGIWNAFCEKVPCNGTSLQLHAVYASPLVEKLAGSRRFAALRAMSRLVPVEMYSSRALELSRVIVDGDQSGSVQNALNGYLNNVADFFDKPVTDELLSNPTCIDGVALISSSHVNGSGGATWSNNAAAVLSPSAFATGIAAMEAFAFEGGEPAGFYPTHLMVGPSNRKLAVDLCGEVRPFPVSASGVEAYSSALAVTAIPNWIAGQIQVIVNPRMTGTYASGWLLMDLSKPGVKPMVVGEAGAVRPVVVDDPQSEPMLHRSSYAYYVEAPAAMVAFAPHCIYGTMTGS